LDRRKDDGREARRDVPLAAPHWRIDATDDLAF
jgi:hypothetical protein